MVAAVISTDKNAVDKAEDIRFSTETSAHHKLQHFTQKPCELYAQKPALFT